MINLLKLDGPTGFYSLEITFVLLMVIWFYQRLFFFPKVRLLNGVHHSLLSAMELRILQKCIRERVCLQWWRRSTSCAPSSSVWWFCTVFIGIGTPSSWRFWRRVSLGNDNSSSWFVAVRVRFRRQPRESMRVLVTRKRKRSRLNTRNQNKLTSISIRVSLNKHAESEYNN